MDKILTKAAGFFAEIGELTPRGGVSKSHFDVTINGKPHIIERLAVTQRTTTCRELIAVIGALDGVAGRLAGGAGLSHKGEKEAAMKVFVEAMPAIISGLCSSEAEAVIVGAAKKAKRAGASALEAYGDNIDSYIDDVDDLLSLGLMVLEVNCGDFLQRRLSTTLSRAEQTDV